MAELLLELFSEEIPARMQPRAAADLKRLLEAACKENSLKFQEITTYSTPRRLTAHVTGLPAKTPDVKEERKGPKAGAPAPAIEGFSKSAGLPADKLVEKDGYLYARIEKKGQAAADVLSGVLPGLLKKFPWPKSMRWGSGNLRWVRPLHSILCLLDGKVVPFEVDGIKSGHQTQGHRFLSPGLIEVKDFADYKHKLNKAHVVLDPEGRKKVILAGAENLAKKQGLSLIGDDALLQEVAGLVEYPVIHIGAFDEAFLEVPEEALISEMRHHQKYFSLKKGGKLAPNFICVSNTQGLEGGAAIIKGNERVLSARLSDAKFFWDQDRKIKLEDRLVKLDDIIFHKDLGSIRWQAARIRALARLLSDVYIPNGDRKLADQAGKLCKADLVSGMVGEFPELQGIMGGYYAQQEGYDPAVVKAIKEHYSPKGPNDKCPVDPVSVAVALADKIAAVVFLFYAGERPTGSKDPFAIRRAGLGLIRLVVENNLRINFRELVTKLRIMDKDFDRYDESEINSIVDEVLVFLADRLKVQQKEKGVRHNLIDAVFSLGGEDDLVRLLARVSALQNFLATDDGENLLAGYKRAVNIVRIEEKKDGQQHTGKIDPKLLKEKEELALYQGLEEEKKSVAKALEGEQFEQAMAAIATLRKPIDDFFDKVTVNVDDKEIRANRLRLLSGIRAALMPIADFSKIDG